jgi:putative FmdB family regulatory protein
MPCYEFVCDKCSTRFENFVRKYDDTGVWADVVCPDCGSDEKKKVPSLPAAPMFTDPRASSKFDNFEYRAGWNLDKAKGERRVAEAKSHMGQTPYRTIDDVSSGKYEGEVK